MSDDQKNLEITQADQEQMVMNFISALGQATQETIRKEFYILLDSIPNGPLRASLLEWRRQYANLFAFRVGQYTRIFGWSELSAFLFPEPAPVEQPDPDPEQILEVSIPTIDQACRDRKKKLAVMLAAKYNQEYPTNHIEIIEGLDGTLSTIMWPV